VLDLDGRELASKTVSVNAPLRFGGVTAYQTDWSMSALQLRVEGSPLAPDGAPIQLPMASLAGGDSKLYATFLPAEDPAAAPPGAAPRGISILARDLQVGRLGWEAAPGRPLRRPRADAPRLLCPARDGASAHPAPSGAIFVHLLACMR
jgi:cytochrome c biogenesis protein